MVGQKCGTTSVYEYLNQHPDAVRCKAKEPHVFDWCWETLRAVRGANAEGNWIDEARLKYMCAFDGNKKIVDGGRKRHAFTGEATPSYILGGAVVARRLRAAAPRVKLVMCLRDPVDRAYSHYNMTADQTGTPEQRKRRGTVAGKCFAELAKEDIALLASCTDACDDRWRSDTRFQEAYLGMMPMGHGSHSYIGRGMYASQLRLWFRVFPRDRFFFLWTGSLRTPTGVRREMEKLFKFLCLPICKLADTSRKNTRKYKPMQTPTRRKLAVLYAPNNKSLLELVSSSCICISEE